MPKLPPFLYALRGGNSRKFSTLWRRKELFRGGGMLADFHFLLFGGEKSTFGWRNARRFSFSIFWRRKEHFRGEECSPIFIFYFFDPKRALGMRKNALLARRELPETLGEAPKEGLTELLGGEAGGGVGVGGACWGEKGRKRAHEYQTSFKTMFGGSESPKIDVLPRREQNAFSKTSSFYAPIWPNLGWRAGLSTICAETRTPAPLVLGQIGA